MTHNALLDVLYLEKSHCCVWFVGGWDDGRKLIQQLGISHIFYSQKIKVCSLGERLGKFFLWERKSCVTPRKSSHCCVPAFVWAVHRSQFQLHSVVLCTPPHMSRPIQLSIRHISRAYILNNGCGREEDLTHCPKTRVSLGVEGHTYTTGKQIQKQAFYGRFL